MTIHFHSKHFTEHKLSLLEYMLLLVYEQTTTATLREIQSILGVSERTVIRVRQELISQGYLKKVGIEHILTTKLYTNEKTTNSAISFVDNLNSKESSVSGSM